MRIKSMVSRIVLSLLMGASSFNVLATFSVKDLPEDEMIASFEAGEADVENRKDLSFVPNVDSLKKHELQISVDTLKRSEFKNTAFRVYDVDNLYEKLAEKDRVFLAKSVSFFPNVLPDFFSVKNHLSFENSKGEKYSEAAFGYAELYDTKENSLHMRKVTKGKAVKAWVHMQDYNIKTKVPHYIDKDKQEALLQHAPLPNSERLEMIFTSYSSENDVIKVKKKKNGKVKNGTRGGRTISYCYRVGEKSTLVVSIKLVTFKKEDIGAGDWSAITSKFAPSFHRSSAKKSLRRKQAFLYPKGS